jgi:carbamoyl-phosphate synthase large subunit
MRSDPKPRAWTEWTVAVTGMNARADNPGPGCAVVRCLREHGAFRGRIIGLGYDALDPGLYHPGTSDDGYLLPYPSEGSAALLDRLDEILAEHPIDALIPCLDAELPNFIAIAPELARRGVRIALPDRQQLRARDKDRLPELCAALDLATPRCQRVTEPRFFESCDEDEDWAYPLVVKGLFYDAHVVEGPDDAKAHAARIAAQWGYPVLVQPFIAGEEFNLTALGDGAGGLIGAVAMRKRAVTEKGKAWAGVTVSEPELEEMAAKLAAHLRWRGPLEVETLRGADGKLYLIEINPRFPAWVYLTHGVDRNLPATLLRLLAGETIADLPPARAGALFIRYAEEVVIGLAQLESILVEGRVRRPGRPGLRVVHGS